MRSEQGSDCSNLYFMKISSLDPKNILLRDQRVVKMHLFFTRKMMVGSNFLLVIHIPQGMEVSKSTGVFAFRYNDTHVVLNTYNGGTNTWGPEEKQPLIIMCSDGSAVKAFNQVSIKLSLKQLLLDSARSNFTAFTKHAFIPFHSCTLFL